MTDFPNISSIISSPMDMLQLNNNEWNLMSLNQLEARYSNNFRENEFLELRYIISTTLLTLRIKNDGKVALPNRPPIISLFNLNDKGCNKWTNLQKNKLYTNKSMLEKEIYWEEKLGQRQGPFFWNRYYNFAKKIDYDNKIKWLQHQIVRNSMKTNYVISKFLENLSPLCSFCNITDEKIEHLFWECPSVQQLVNDAATFFNRQWVIDLNLTKKIMLFGKNSESPSSPTNLIIGHFKKYIWYNRCKKIPLSCEYFLRWFRSEIEIIKIAFVKIPHFNYLTQNNFQL